MTLKKFFLFKIAAVGPITTKSVSDDGNQTNPSNFVIWKFTQMNINANSSLCVSYEGS